MHADFIKEITSTLGVGPITLVEVSGYTRISKALSVGDTIEYSIRSGDNWEAGLGTVGAGNTLARTIIYTTLVSGTYDNTSPDPISLTGTSIVIGTLGAQRINRVAYVTDFGAVGDGTIDDRAAFASADTGTFTLPSSTYSIQSDITLTNDIVFMPGGILKPASGVTITINGAIQAGQWQIFDLSAGGLISFGAVNEVNVAWFGALADDSTDNSTALTGMRDSLQLSPTVFFTVKFEADAYRYTDNTWLYGINRIKLICHGTTFYCTNTSATDRIRRTINFIPMFWDEGGTGTQISGSTDHDSGYLLDTANSGATTVVTSTASEAGNFSVGDWVFIHAYEQQGSGFPANMRYIFYTKVVSVDSGTGNVVIDEPLIFKVRSDLTDRITDGSNSKGYGAARILNLNRGLTKFEITEELIIEGGNWLENPVGTAANSDMTFGSCINLVVRNAVISPGSVSGCKSVLFDNCEFTDEESFEIDKNLELVEFRNSRLRGGLSAGTGAVNVILSHGTVIEGSPFELDPRYLTITECVINGTTGSSGASASLFAFDNNYCTRVATFRDNRWVNSGGHKNFVKRDPPNSLTIDSVSTNDIAVDTATNGVAIQSIDIGTFLYKDDGTEWGFVTDLYFSGTDFYIAGTWMTPTATDTWQWRRVQKYYGDNNVVEPTISLRATIGNANESELTTSIGPVKKLFWTSRDQNFDNLNSTSGYTDLEFEGFIQKITIRVLKVYGGADPTPTVEVINQSPNTNFLAVVNTGTLGTRSVDLNSTAGAVAGDTLISANLDQFVDELRIIVDDMTHADNTELPVFSVEIDWLPPTDYGQT